MNGYPPLATGWVLRVAGCSIQVRPRSVTVAFALLACLLVLTAVTLMTGGLDLTLVQVWDALHGEGSQSAVRSVHGRRLPRALTAIAVGAGLGASGAVFQSLSRNVLGSPDIIGFTAGAATGAVIQIGLFGGGVLATAVAAILGGIVTALIVYTLARHDGVAAGLRLVLVGIGVGAILAAFTSFIMITLSLDNAAVVQQWNAGSLTGRGWTHAVASLAAVGMVLPPLVAVCWRVTRMEMGDDLAQGLGIAVERYRFAAVLLAVILAAVATAAAGPIAFVALAAPHLARALLSCGGVLLIGSALVGGALLAAADLLAQSIDIGLRTPVGLVTSLLGGAYLVVLLARRA